MRTAESGSCGSLALVDLRFALCEHDLVNVVKRRTLLHYDARHPDAAEPLDRWYRMAKRARWQNLDEVQNDFPHGDTVGKCTVFNIGGNKYRLIVKFDFWGQAVYIKHLLTHAEYSKGRWRDDC
jgi:mRNA interferase HigB